MSARNVESIRISPGTTDASFPSQSYATKVSEFVLPCGTYRHSYWSPEAWARTPEESRNSGTIVYDDGAAVLIEPVE